MSGNWTCWLWTMVGAGFLGWGVKGIVLGPVIDDKCREVERLMGKVTMLANQPPEVRTVEKRVEVPVERVVLKRVEVPVEKIVERLVEVPIEKAVEKVVDRPVDNPEYLVRIKALESEVAMIAGLLPQIAQYQTVASQVGGRSNEGRVLVPVENPEQVARIKALEEEIVVIAGFLAQIAQAQTVALEAGGVRRSEERVVVPVDNPEHVARIKALEDEVAVIADLRAQIAELRDRSVQAGEQVVEKRIEIPTAQTMNVPIDQVSEQVVDFSSAGAEPLEEEEAGKESPDDLKHIRGVGPGLERFLHKRGVFWFRQVATWSQADIDKFEFLLPNFGGRIQRENWVQSARVEYYKKYKQWLGDGEPPSESPDLRGQSAEVEAVSSQAGEKVIEKRIETSAEQVVVQNGDVSVETISAPAGDLAHTGAVEPSDEGQEGEESPDDLKHIRGVGPGLERFLHKRGVFWFRQVATWSQADIDKFEFLLPNFSGRIQRERWVQSARVEHYKKYKQWLGADGPTDTTPDAH
jgi:predicted flap endonuclease-1-like 5' DNA nuclease